MNTQLKISDKERLLTALYAFIAQRPGLEYGNYGDPVTYRSEMRSITKDRHDAEALLSAVARHESITYANLKDAMRAYSGRLTWDENMGRLDYCTGQYFPTEYRKAVCAVCAQALWDWLREHCNCKTGDEIRAAARREFKASIARRWFN